MTEDEARNIDALNSDQAELFADKIRAGRRLTPVCDPREAAAAHRYAAARAAWAVGAGPHPADGVTTGPLPTARAGYGFGAPD